jgi:hypothetical protein
MSKTVMVGDLEFLMLEKAESKLVQPLVNCSNVCIKTRKKNICWVLEKR